MVVVWALAMCNGLFLLVVDDKDGWHHFVDRPSSMAMLMVQMVQVHTVGQDNA